MSTRLVTRITKQCSSENMASREERSAYVAVCQLFERALPQHCEMIRLMQGCAHTRSVFEVPRSAFMALFQAFNAHRTNEHHYQSPEFDDVISCLVYTELRYCLTCLRQGAHSVLFQHPLVDRCPCHDELLRTGCPSCRRRLRTDLEATRFSPFCCTHCGHSLRTPGLSRNAHLALDVGDFEDPRVRLGHRIGNTDSTSRSVLLGDLYLDALRARLKNQAFVWAAWRHVGWADTDTRPVSASWTLTSSEHGPATDEDHSFLAARTVVKTLRRLQDTLSESGVGFQVLEDRPWIYLKCSGLNCSLPVAAIAFYRTAQLYNVLDVVMRPEGRANFLLQMFGPIPTHPEAAELVVEREVLGLFARCLGAASRAVHMDEVSWTQAPAIETFCPAWRVSVIPTGCKLQLRSLVDEKRVQRLLARLGRRVLQASNDYETAIRLHREANTEPPEGWQQTGQRSRAEA